jgi:hypothetical protein
MNYPTSHSSNGPRLAQNLKTPLVTTATLAALLLLALPAVVQAQFSYTIDNGTVTITGYYGAGGAVAIPSRINGWPVTTIGDFAFYYCTSITAITVRPLNARCRVL